MLRKESAFHIILNVKTGGDFETIGKFFIGGDRKFATSVFEQLKGKREVDEHAILTLDLVESKNELPLNLNMISCTLDELAENCRIVARETFKQFNLEK
jgi:hypothetical protein